MLRSLLELNEQTPATRVSLSGFDRSARKASVKGACLRVLYFLNDSSESFGVVEGEVGENFAVHFNAALVNEAHELGVAQVVHACSGVDTLNPESAEVSFVVLAVAVGVGKTFFPGVFSYGPYITAAAEVASSEFEDFFAASARSNVVD